MGMYEGGTMKPLSSMKGASRMGIRDTATFLSVKATEMMSVYAAPAKNISISMKMWIGNFQGVLLLRPKEK